jgi:MFS family permease
VTTSPALTAERSSARAERFFLPAVFVTNLGNNIQLIAASLLVFKASGTALAVGWVFIAVAVPQVLLSFFFGRIADRFDRRTLCVIADLGSALAAAALPTWLLLGGVQSAAAYTTSFILSAFAALFMPASNALMKERIAGDRLGKFNANYEIATQAGFLLSAGVGGFAIQHFGAIPLFFFNGLTFLTSAVCLFAMGRRYVAAPLSAQETADAAAAAAAAPAVPTAPRQLVIKLGMLFVVGSVIITVVNTVLLVLVVERFKQGAGLLGITDALAGIGIMFAAAHYKRLKDRVDYRWLILLGYIAVGITDMLMPISVPVLLPAILAGGYFFGIARISARTELMSAIDQAKAGRVFGTANAFGLATSLVATIVIATVSDNTNIVVGFILLGLIGIVPTTLIIATMTRDAKPTIEPSVPKAAAAADQVAA